MSAPINQAMLLGDLRDPLDTERLAGRGVDAFLAIYGPRSHVEHN